jgi:hypothetical protein
VRVSPCRCRSTGRASTPVRLRLRREYYLSPESLARNPYLRQWMDVDGFVPVSVLASFPRVRAAVGDPAVDASRALVLALLRRSTVLEVSDEREAVRPRSDWRQWLWPQPDGTRGRPLAVAAPAPAPAPAT